jgi:IS1 family transposase
MSETHPVSVRLPHTTTRLLLKGKFLWKKMLLKCFLNLLSLYFRPASAYSVPSTLTTLLSQLGDAYTFVAFERNTKLIITWHLGRRSNTDTQVFIEKLFDAVDGTTNRFQITTDGFAGYPPAIAYSLGTRTDYAQLIKIYGVPEEDDHKYSPSKIKEIIPMPQWGNPNPERICTSHVERQNLNIRMGLRRFTRLTNGFSKKWENLKAAIALYFAYYNFCRIHSSIRCTPAMESGITNHVWTMQELLG